MPAEVRRRQTAKAALFRAAIIQQTRIKLLTENVTIGRAYVERTRFKSLNQITKSRELTYAPDKYRLVMEHRWTLGNT